MYQWWFSLQRSGFLVTCFVIAFQPLIKSFVHKTFNKWLKRDDETRYKEPATLEAKPPLVHKTQQSAGTSDGSTASYYELPDGAAELQDLISHKNMNSQIGEIFRACYRMGEASHSNELRDAKKIKFYIDAEIKRLGG